MIVLLVHIMGAVDQDRVIGILADPDLATDVVADPDLATDVVADLLQDVDLVTDMVEDSNKIHYPTVYAFLLANSIPNKLYRKNRILCLVPFQIDIMFSLAI